MTQNDKLQKSPRQKRWPRIVLVVSLGLNLLVIGAGAGAFFMAPRPGGHIGARDFAPLGLRSYVRALDDENRETLREDIKARRGEIQFGRRLIRGHHKALATALRTTPFDVDAVRAVLAQQQAAVVGNIELGQDLLMKRITAMSPAARADFADKLELERDQHKKRDSGS